MKKIVALGFLLRILGIFIVPINFEETHNILLSQQKDLRLMVQVAAESYPPLYFFLVKAVNPRALSLIFGIITIPTIYYIGKKLFSPKAGLLAAFLVSISPSMIYYSSVGRMYSLVILESLVTSYLFLKFLRKKKFTFPLILVATLGLYTHYYFIILLFFLNIYAFFHLNNLRKTISNLMLTNIAIFILSLPLVFLILNGSRPQIVPGYSLLKLPLFWITPILPWDLIQSNQNNVLGNFYLALSGLSFAPFIFTIFMIKKNVYFKIFVFMFILPAIGVLVYSRFIYGIAGIRSYVVFSPIFFLLMGLFLTKINKKFKKAFLLTASFFMFLLYLLNLKDFSSNSWNKIYQNFASSDTIVYNDVVYFLPSKLLKPKGSHLLFYPGYLDQISIEALNIKISTLNDLSWGETIWYMKSQTDWPPFEKKANELERLLLEDYKEIKKNHYRNLKLIYYEK